MPVIRVFLDNLCALARLEARLLTIVAYAGFVWALSANPAVAAIHADCDIPVGNIKSLAAADKEVCQKMCVDSAQCQGFVFVSGWNRCQLKTSVKMRPEVVMYGGFKTESGISSFGPRHDHTGKDMRRVSPSKSEVACQTECQKDQLCLGYVWIGGYGDCWLKKTVGKSLPKQFWCGTVERASSP